MLKKILNHSFWLLIGNSVGRLTMFMANIVVARVLPQEVFGQFTIIRSTISSIEGLLSGALASPIIKKISETANESTDRVNFVASTLFFTNISIAIILALMIYFLSPIIVESFFIAKSELIFGLKIGSFLIIATSLSNIMQSMLIGLEEFKKIAFAGIVASLISFPLVVALIIFFGFYGAIWGVVIYFISDFACKYYLLRKYLSFSFTHNITSMSQKGIKLLKSSSPLFLSVVIATISFWYARVIVVQETNSFEDIAIFDAAFQWLTIIMTITGATTSIVLPMLSKKSNAHDIKKIFIINFLVNLCISILIALFFIFFSKEIMSIYGPKYLQGYSTLVVLAITSVFFTLATLFNRYMVARNRNWVIFFTTLLSGITLFSYLMFSINMNAYTLAISVFLYYLTSTILYLIFYQRKDGTFAQYIK